MNSYLISYDLMAPNKDYSKLISAIKEYGTYAKVLESCWIVKSSNTAKEIRDNLKNHIDANDKLFVVKLAGVGAWYNLSDKVSEWLKDNL